MDRLVSESGFAIKTKEFEGPFELVLELVESRKLLVNELALANITDDYIQHIRSRDTFPVEETANFIQIAATLLLIKSKSLIPDILLTEDEQADVCDLKQRLEAYEKIRISAQELAHIFGRNVMFPAGERASEPIFSPSSDLSSISLADSLSRVLAARTETEALPEVKIKPLITIEEMMKQLALRVERAMTLSFKEFAHYDDKEKTEIIVSFLALLELVKQGAVAAEQYVEHGDIRISHTETSSVPRY